MEAEAVKALFPAGSPVNSELNEQLTQKINDPFGDSDNETHGFNSRNREDKPYSAQSSRDFVSRGKSYTYVRNGAANSLALQAEYINIEELSKIHGVRGTLQIQLQKRFMHNFESPMGMCVTKKYFIIGNTMKNEVKVKKLFKLRYSLAFF